MIKKWFWTFIGLSLLPLYGIFGPYTDFFVIAPVPVRSARFLKDASALPIQGPPFQPILLSFDHNENRLLVAAPGERSGSSRLLLFRHPEKEAVSPEELLRFPGVSSGLAYDPEEKILFMANATNNEILIFDRFKPGRTLRHTRALRRFNFPTGIGTDSSTDRLFVADAHPGAILVFDRMNEIQGLESPSRTIGPETGLNGPFSLATDTKRGRLYVSNFDGVFVFNLNALSARPERLPFSSNTLARGLAFDPLSGRLYIAAPMLRSYFIYDGEHLEQIRLEGVKGAFPFSLAIDPENDRLYLAGTDPKVGVIHRASGSHLPKQSPGEKRRPIDRWIRWSDSTPSPHPPIHPKPSPEAPSMIDTPFVGPYPDDSIFSSFLYPL